MAAVLVLRHGITEWNAAQRWQGWTDVPLSDTGLAQARSGRERLRTLGGDYVGFARVVASDLERAWRTAEILAGAFAAPVGVEVEKDLSLRERNVGDWAGLTTPQIRDGWPGALEGWRAGQLERPPNGESEDEFSARVTAALRDLCATAARARRPALAVCHGGVIHAMERAFGADHHPVANLCGRWFSWPAWPDGDVAPGEHVDLLDGSGPRPVGTAL